ncbi:MAG: TonB-dependent receptor [Rikenellaceae bacterium]
MQTLRGALLLIIISFAVSLSAQNRTYTLRGSVVSDSTREPLPYVAVTVDGQPQRGGVTNEDGEFEIRGVEPGIFRLVGQSIGYEEGYSDQVQVSAQTPTITLTMRSSSESIDEIVVRPSLFRKMVESPVSMRRVGVQQIEKSPGANRDVSKIVQSYPGVAFSPAGYRNDLIVRGGSPSENKFYVDGIEIPNINHFSTQGSSGGPVGILNADLISEIEFYTGAFPTQRSGALSSIMEVKLKDGDTDKQSFKATLGASEVSLSGSGHISDKTTYLFSARQSYLQLLFKVLGLPFLPNYIDGQLKINHKISPNDELTILALTGIDNMTLNEDGTTETSEYLLGYLPQIEQQTYVGGVRYRHFDGENSYSLVASHSYVNNLNLKYMDNDESDPDNLTLRLRSRDHKTTLRNENRNTLSSLFTVRYGAQLEYNQFGIDSYTLSTAGNNLYDTSLNFLSWGLHSGIGYRSADEKLSASAGFRFDGNTFSDETTHLWEQFSPRLSASYSLGRGFAMSGATGIYYAMPALTALSYREGGVAVNSDLGYTRVVHYTAGIEWQPRREIFTSIETFYKDYSNMAVSIENNTPLADVGIDYGTVGNEALSQGGVGRAYGVELLGEWQVPGKVAMVASLTLYRSEYATSGSADYRPSAWDSRFIFNASGTYFMKRGWSVGAKVSAIGGAPFTPYDIEGSSFINYWDIASSPKYDYTQHNTQRLNAYTQLDLRVDKTLYFSKWMLGLYIDLQNALTSEYKQQSIPISTGEVDPSNSDNYTMKELNNVSGTMLPTFGITATF